MTDFEQPSPKDMVFSAYFKRARKLRFAQYGLTGSGLVMLGPAVQETLFGGNQAEKYLVATGATIGALAVVGYFKKQTESQVADLMIEIAEDAFEDPS